MFKNMYQLEAECVAVVVLVIQQLMAMAAWFVRGIKYRGELDVLVDAAVVPFWGDF